MFMFQLTSFLEKGGANGGFESGMMGGFGVLAGVFLLVMGIIWLAVLALGIITLINIYTWGMADKAVFEKIKEDKKKWFQLLLLLPMVCSLIAIVPFIGWLVGLAGYIYWAVMTLKFFFTIRKKLV
ncbi:MAG: hypothetical protein WCP18_01190 [bacterium]